MDLSAKSYNTTDRDLRRGAEAELKISKITPTPRRVCDRITLIVYTLQWQVQLISHTLSLKPTASQPDAHYTPNRSPSRPSLLGYITS